MMGRVRAARRPLAIAAMLGPLLAGLVTGLVVPAQLAPALGGGVVPTAAEGPSARLLAALRGLEAAVGRTWLLSRLAARGEMRRDETVEGVTVVHGEADAESASLVADQVRESVGKIRVMLGAAGEGGPRPGARVWVVLVGDERDMAGFLGPRYGFNTLGAYWRGTILVLSPRAWLGTSDPAWRERFLEEGPVVHELAHLVLDRATLGRVPPWLDEGLAQYVEFALTGYEWTEGRVGVEAGYPLAELARSFRELPDEALAYREAFLLVRFLVERRGQGALAELTAGLRRGEDGLAAFARVAGLDVASLEPAWRRWLEERRPDRPGVEDGRGR